MTHNAIIKGLFALFQQGIIFAQTSPCASAEHHREMLAKNPALVQKQTESEMLYQQWISSARKSQRAVISIPIVVHVVHDGDSIGQSENISDAQIFSQIDAINIDYRKLNSDTANIPAVFKPLAADFEIEFCLAAQDPEGNATTGIERINGQRTTWTIAFADQFKPSTIWNPHQYLNVWVLRLGGTNSSTLGYAQFPGMPDSTDGVVIDYKAFGTIGDLLPDHDLGKTLTHEIGHWLGLMHVWGDDNGACNQDDLVNDTPIQSTENYGCPAFPHVSCNNGPNGDMFMNYMDYVDDDCSMMFTNGQKTRADFFFSNDRASILTSPGCEPAPVYERDMALTELVFPTEEICTENFIPVIRVKNLGTITVVNMLMNYQVDGVGLNQYMWYGNIASGASAYIWLPQMNFTQGAHSLYIYMSSPNGAADQHIGNEDVLVNFNVNSIGVGESIPVDEGFEAGVIPATWQLQNPGNDRAWKVDTSAGAAGSSNSAMFDNFSGNTGSNPRGTRDGLITAEYDFRSVSQPTVSFDVAYARRNPSSKDSLILYYSLDCGYSWTRLWAKTGSALATAADVNVKFVPQSNEWREEGAWVDLLSGQYKVKFKFENYSDWGNNIYIDNFKVNPVTVGMAQPDAENIKLEVFPNPNEGIFNVNVSTKDNGDFRLEVLNISGQLVKEIHATKITEWQGSVDLGGFPKGIYILRMVSDISVACRKVIMK